MTTGYATLEEAILATDEEARARHPAGRYFTDGTNLYRIAAWLARPVGPDLAEIEECHSLDRILIRSDDLLCLELAHVHADSDAEPVAA